MRNTIEVTLSLFSEIPGLGCAEVTYANTLEFVCLRVRNAQLTKCSTLGPWDSVQTMQRLSRDKW